MMALANVEYGRSMKARGISVVQYDPNAPWSTPRKRPQSEPLVLAPRSQFEDSFPSCEPDYEPLHDMRSSRRLVRTDNRDWGSFYSSRMGAYCKWTWVLTLFRPPLEPVDADERAEARLSSAEASAAVTRSYNRDDRARGGNSKPRRAHDDRTTLRGMRLADRDTLETRRLDHLFTEIEADRTKRTRHLVAA